MINRIAPNTILSIIWLVIPESKLIIGIYFLISSLISILINKDKSAQRLLYFLGLMALIPVFQNEKLIYEILILILLNFFIYQNLKKENFIVTIIIYVMTSVSYVFFNYLYSIAGKILSIISYLGFDNTGHLGLLFAITKKGNYLNPFNASETDLGLTFWKYYPQGVVGSISATLRVLGLEMIDKNKFSFYLVYIIFNLLIYFFIFYLFFLICKIKNKKLRITQIIIIFLLTGLLGLYSFTSLFFVNGFINYSYGILLIELYILGLIQKKPFSFKVLILFLIFFTSPFIFPIFICVEFYYSIINFKKSNLINKFAWKFIFIASVCCVYFFYFTKNWGLGYLSTPGFVPSITLKEIIIIPIFLLLFLFKIHFKKTRIEEIELVTIFSILIFVILSGTTLMQTGNISYYAIKQGYIALILTLFNISYYAVKVSAKSKIQFLVLVILIAFFCRSEMSITSKINFYNKYGDNSPWININGKNLLTATALVQLMDYKEYLYIGYYDADLSSRILNGSISNWNDLNSGLFFGLQGNADLVNIEKQINGLSELAYKLKVPELVLDRDKILIFYEKNTTISKNVTNKTNGLHFYFIG